MSRIVIVAYRPKPGRATELAALMSTHLATLREQDLVTDREAITMQAADGTVVEVFEWQSAAAIEAAHGNPAVQVMWARYAEVCDYIPVAEVPEAQQLFSEFTPIG